MLLVIFGVLGVTNAQAEHAEKTVDADADGNVSISNVAGSIEVTGWSRDEVEVIAELGRDVEELIVERDGGDVIIKVKVPRRNSRNISSDLVVHVPENSSVEAAGVSADIEVSDVFGELRLNTVSGDLDSDVYESDVQIETVSGDIGLQGDDRAMLTEAMTVSGDIDTSNLSGDIEIETVSGDLVVIEGSFERVQASSVNGDIVFHSELADDGKLEIETINGEVDVEFSGSISGRFDVETFNGDIDNCFGPESERTSRYTPGRELSFSEGDGDARVIIQTLNGDVRICRD